VTEALVTGDAGDLKPRPDPTTLTAVAVDRVRDDLRREIAGLREIIETRLAAIDDRHAAQADVAARIRLELEEEVRHLRELGGERFSSIRQQLNDRDLRITEASGAADKALTAALSATRELVEARAAAAAAAADKYELQIAAQIRQLSELAAASRDALDAKIGALKERIDRGEGQGQGAAVQRFDQRASLGTVIAAVATLVAVVSFVLYVIKK
jgi:chromosome segregation ATPase